MNDTSKKFRISTGQRRFEMATNALMACVYGLFMYAFITNFLNYGKISSLLMVIQMSIVVVLFIVREYPQRISYSRLDWGVALTGTILPIFIRPTGAPSDDMILLGAQVFGILLTTLGLLSLNKSFGFVAAVRVVKTKGVYQYIRHPIYCGYFFSIGSIVLQNFNLLNIAIFAAVCAADVYRILAEERILSQEAEYRAFKERVKWRIFPYLW